MQSSHVDGIVSSVTVFLTSPVTVFLIEKHLIQHPFLQSLYQGMPAGIIKICLPAMAWLISQRKRMILPALSRPVMLVCWLAAAKRALGRCDREGEAHVQTARFGPYSLRFVGLTNREHLQNHGQYQHWRRSPAPRQSAVSAQKRV